MRARLGSIIVFVAVVAQLSPAAGASVPAEAWSDATTRRILDQYCISCHNDALRTAGVGLQSLDVSNIAAGAPVWERVVQKLRSGTMPPPGRPRPARAVYDGLASWLESELDRAALAAPNPGRPAPHRLNRGEYTNAVRDLLAVEIDSTALPADDSGHGFDNVADVLSISPGLLERYLSAARRISELAVGRAPIRASTATYRVSPERRQDERMDETLPFGTRGGLVVRHHFPLDGEYEVRARLQRVNNLLILGLQYVNHVEVRIDGVRVAQFSVGGKYADQPGKGGQAEEEYWETADEHLHVRVPVKAGLRSVAVTFARRTSAAPDQLAPARYPVAGYIAATPISSNEDHDARIEAVDIAGPYAGLTASETESRRRIFVCQPSKLSDEDACARRIATTLARRAYRRSPTPDEIRTLMAFYESGREGRSFEAGIQWMLERVLVAPEFLFRLERGPRDPAGVSYQLSDIDLASRMSFFLWSSVPDDELLDVAERRRLRDPDVLERQVRRMLADPRSTSLVSNFVAQWLLLRNIRFVVPNASKFPEFDESLREAFRQETELFVTSQLRNDQSVLDLVRADYTFLNERLARYYGVAGVYGSHFRRVAVADVGRGGLLGHGSILTVTSYPTRTSPVLRGKWLLENLLGSPPPPPPPNVPSLGDRRADGTPATVRERMEQHRRNPVCAGCHAQMDPLGFAMENFDATGRWRSHDSESAQPIDTAATLPDGTKVDGIAELRRLLVDRREQLVTTMTTKLLTYALGRGVEYYDMPTVRDIRRQAAANDYRWSALILGVIKSAPFQMKLVRSDER